MTIVGANQWRGGFKEYNTSKMFNSYQPLDIELDSYLGKNIIVHIVHAVVYLHCSTVHPKHKSLEKDRKHPNEE